MQIFVRFFKGLHAQLIFILIPTRIIDVKNVDPKNKKRLKTRF